MSICGIRPGLSHSAVVDLGFKPDSVDQLGQQIYWFWDDPTNDPTAPGFVAFHNGAVTVVGGASLKYRGVTLSGEMPMPLIETELPGIERQTEFDYTLRGEDFHLSLFRAGALEIHFTLLDDTLMLEQLVFCKSTGQWEGNFRSDLGLVALSLFGESSGPSEEGITMLQELVENFDQVYRLLRTTALEDLSGVLIESGADEDSVSEFADEVGKDPTVLSRHLKVTGISQKRWRRKRWCVGFDVALPPWNQARHADVEFGPQGMSLARYSRSSRVIFWGS